VRREPPKPLIDLTPTYREPPQHLRKGRGFKPDEVGAGGLIDNATSPEDFINAPPSTDWRGRNATASPPVTNNGLLTANGVAHNTSSSRSPHRTRSTSRNNNAPPRFQNTQAYAALHGSSASPVNGPSSDPMSPQLMQEYNDPAFVPGGLLAHAASGQGGKDTGRGVSRGHDAKNGPLLDINQGSMYPPGSLLHRVEKVEGGPRGPLIDRER